MKTLAADVPAQPPRLSSDGPGGEAKSENPPPMQVIRASEIGIYLYCARARWYQTLQQLPTQHSTDLEQGISAHDTYGKRLRFAYIFRRLGIYILIAGFVVLILFVAIWWTAGRSGNF